MNKLLTKLSLLSFEKIKVIRFYFIIMTFIRGTTRPLAHIINETIILIYRKYYQPTT